MQTQVKTWGNSQGTRISKEILQEANIAVDDALDVNVVNGMITLVKPFGHKTLEERAADFNGNLNLIMLIFRPFYPLAAVPTIYMFFRYCASTYRTIP